MSERQKKNWVPGEKADYVKELVELIGQENDERALAEKLSVYHENDIAEAFELLDEDGRRKLYRVLDTEWMSEVFAYLDDVGTYLEELEADAAADIIENMTDDGELTAERGELMAWFKRNTIFARDGKKRMKD